MTAARRACFIDRDGTLVVDLVRSVDVSRLQLKPRVPEAVRALNDAGWPVVVVTNQSGINRGLYTEADMRRFHDEIARRIADASGGRIDAWYHCPHRPDEGCPCRKPGHRMLEDAARDRGLDLARCAILGDSWRDVAAGSAVGARTVLVPDGDGDYEKDCREGLGGRVVWPDFVARDLLEAARWVARAL